MYFTAMGVEDACPTSTPSTAASYQHSACKDAVRTHTHTEHLP